MSSQWWKTGFTAAVVAMSSAAFAQGVPSPTQSPRGNQTQPAAQDPQMSHADRKHQGTSDERKLVEHMLAANTAEIALGQMAATRAGSGDVKSFAEMMVREHTQSNGELMPIAEQLGITPPAALDSKHRKLSDRLAKLEGADFDRQYMSAMVEGHKQVETELARATGKPVGTTGTKMQIKTAGDIAAKTLPVVQEHLHRAEEISRNLERSK